MHESASNVNLKNLNEAAGKTKNLSSHASQLELELKSRHRKSQSLLSEHVQPKSGEGAAKGHIRFNLLEGATRNFNPIRTIKRKTVKAINS